MIVMKDVGKIVAVSALKAGTMFVTYKALQKVSDQMKPKVRTFAMPENGTAATHLKAMGVPLQKGDLIKVT